MGKLISFNFTTLNGYFKGPGEDYSWHKHGEEEAAYASESSQQSAVLVFGRKTYDIMSSFWPSPMAKEQMPVVADGMNKSEKIVISHTLTKPTWSNTTAINKDVVAEMQKLKKTKDMCILGSGSIVSQLADANLIDEFQIMVDPVVIPQGTPLFSNMKNKLNLKLTKTQAMKKSGVVLLVYEPVR